MSAFKLHGMETLLKTVGLKENITSTVIQICKHRNIHTSCRRMDGKLIDGIKRSEYIQEKLRRNVMLLKEKGFKAPQLATILVGDDYASQIYIERKTSAAAAVGISAKTIQLKSSIREEDLLSLITSLNQDQNIHGILVQLPLPKHIRVRTVCDLIAPSKDVDGFNSVNLGRFVLGMDTFLPCTALAVQDLILSSGIQTKGKHAVVCGRSKNVGLPIAMVLHANEIGGAPGLNTTTTICHRFTPPAQLSSVTRSADILVTATGVPNLITSSMVKPGACIIDVGISRLKDENSGKMRLTGDVNFNEVRKVAGFITPVPGGVGPMTVAMLLKNTFKAAVLQMGIANHRE